MTGELADCFASKAEGVKFILQAVHEAADGRHTRVYLVDGTLVSLNVALTRPLLAASSNWHALGRFCGRFAAHRPAWLIDIGSTTVDFIPLLDGLPVVAGTTDMDRLLAGQLVYTGIERSPVCALVQTFPYRGQECPVAQEVFATTRDVYLLLGDLPESPDDRHTADHQPATRDAACRRMARMLSANETQFGTGRRHGLCPPRRPRTTDDARLGGPACSAIRGSASPQWPFCRATANFWRDVCSRH